MIIVDANVLLYAYNPASRSHANCRAWLENALNGDEPVGLPWQSILAFLRIATNDRVFEKPLGIAVALEIVDDLLASPAVVMVDPSQGYWKLLRGLLIDAQVSGPLVSDAALAGLALEHGASMCTTDRDFRRFKGLRIVDPVSIA